MRMSISINIIIIMRRWPARLCDGALRGARQPAFAMLQVLGRRTGLPFQRAHVL